MSKKLIEGLIIRAYNSFYYVKPTDSDDILTCKLRGRFKQERFSLLVGDRVLVELGKDGTTGSIDEILPRSSFLLRPAVANLEQVILVFAMRQPDYSLMLIDKMLALYSKSGVELVLCFNKFELAAGDQQILCDIYENIGYKLLFTSARDGIGVDGLRQCLQGKISAFAGPSGVGKSSLLNALQPGLALQTGELSDKIGRGKHTTRYSQLLDLNIGGYIADTPGFSSVDTELFREDNLSSLFVDIKKISQGCKFASCKHDQEPSCAVKEAVESGELTGSRYENYMNILQEIKELRDKRR